jgi:hypothetical protein
MSCTSHPPLLSGQYVGTIICILVFGITSIALKTSVSLLSMSWKQSLRAQASAGGVLTHSWLLPSG